MSSPTREDLASMAMISANEGWVVGTGGVIRHFQRASPIDQAARRIEASIKQVGRGPVSRCSISYPASLMNLRHAFISAKANNVTVLASSGDGGSTNAMKEPVKNPAVIPYPSVSWPASDPLVTEVGGTYLCTDTTTGTSVDSASYPTNCQNNPGVREVGWIDAGGGYSM